MERWRAASTRRTEHPRLLEIILEESGYTDMLQADKSPQSQTRLDNLKELVRAMGAFDTLNAFLEHVELVMDNAEGSGADDQVQIFTLHSAKGLEWPMVFLPGWEEEVFPSRRSLDESGAKGLEEERRLAYVGITRARERAYISFAANRQIYGRWTQRAPQPLRRRTAAASTSMRSARPATSPPAASSTAARSRGIVPSGATTGGDCHRAGLEPSSTTRAPISAAATTAPAGSAPRPPPRARNTAPARHRRPRLPRRGFRRPPARSAAARPATCSPRPTPQPPAASQLGQRIFHDKFGYGRITDIDGAKLTVDFEKAGMKKVVESFVKRV